MNVTILGDIWVATPIRGGVRLTLRGQPRVWFDLMAHNPVTLTPWVRAS